MDKENRNKGMESDREAKSPYAGRYVYCVAEGSESVNFGKIGIENNKVYTVPCGGICAVVHNCLPQPYKSEYEEEVKNWVKAHQDVINAASKKLGTVIPLSFDIIIRGSDEGVLNWLREESKGLMQKINKVKGKQEFGVQIFWDRKLMGDKVASENIQIKKMKLEIGKEARGKAYFLKQRMGKILKNEIEKAADDYFKKIYSQIRDNVDDIRVERTKRVGDRQMLMNLSCLVHKDKVKQLGALLGGINNLEGVSVRFTGPWPAYSFV